MELVINLQQRLVMNYRKIYHTIVTRAKAREIVGYTEIHHIQPKCLGGSDLPDNLVELTAREHFVAHQLLVKIYPGNASLIFAANMMSVNSPNHQRINNRVYEWLKVKFSEAMSENQTGENNSQFGTKWVHNSISGESKKIKEIELQTYTENGWTIGRVAERKKHSKSCKKCGERICLRSDICKKHQMINTLVDNFGFNCATIGTDEFYAEYDRVVQMLYNEYHVDLLSTLDLSEKYSVSSQRIDSIFKSLGIPKRNHKDALNNFCNKK